MKQEKRTEVIFSNISTTIKYILKYISGDGRAAEKQRIPLAGHCERRDRVLAAGGERRQDRVGESLALLDIRDVGGNSC